MSSHRHPRDYSNRQQSDEDRPILPPIRDWFRDELASSASLSNPPMPYHRAEPIPTTRFRGMPALAPPGQAPPMGPQQSSPHFYKNQPATHAYPSHPDAARSYAPPKHTQAIMGDHYVVLQGPGTPQQVHRANTPIHYRSHSGRHMNDNTPLAASQEAGPSSFPRTERYEHSSPGRSSPLSKYECSYCGKCFNRPSSLKTHLNTHTGEKPFICPYEGCGRAFSVQSNMRRHARVHTQLSSQTNSDSSGEDTDLPFERSLCTSSSPHTTHASSQPASSSATTSISVSSAAAAANAFPPSATQQHQHQQQGTAASSSLYKTRQ